MEGGYPASGAGAVCPVPVRSFEEQTVLRRDAREDPFQRNRDCRQRTVSPPPEGYPGPGAGTGRLRRSLRPCPVLHAGRRDLEPDKEVGHPGGKRYGNRRGVQLPVGPARYPGPEDGRSSRAGTRKIDCRHRVSCEGRARAALGPGAVSRSCLPTANRTRSGTG